MDEQGAALDLTLLAALSSTGLIMGGLTTFVGLLPNVEAVTWIAWYVVWVVVVERRGTARPFVHILAASLLTGLLASLVQLAFFDAYVDHNPDYAHRLVGMTRAEAAPGFITQGLLASLVTGAVVGGIALLRRRRQA